MKIGDKVRVSNVNLATYGRVGCVVGGTHLSDLVRVRVDGKVRTYNVENLKVIDMKKKDDYHVAIIACVDDKIEMDFSGGPPLETMEDDFNLACEGEVLIGSLDDIKVDVMDRLNEWDNVVGLIDNKLFKASRSIVFEGVEL